MNATTAGDLVREIAGGREDLLELGRQINGDENDRVIAATTKEFEKRHSTKEAMAKLAGSPISEESKVFLRQMSRLGWKRSDMHAFLTKRHNK